MALPSRLSPFARFSWGVLALNVLVVLWGAFVRATGSGAGCGQHWPLCNGDTLPEMQRLATRIEFGHRVSSGIAAVLVVAMAVWAFRAFPRGSGVRRAAVASVVFIAGEVAIGAGLVLLRLVELDQSMLRGVSISLHLANTFLLMGALVLTAWWASGGPPLRLRGRAHGAVTWGLVAGLGAMLVVGLSGAIAALGDTLFPAASLGEGMAQDFSAGAHLFVRLRTIHPFVAVGASVAVVLVAQLARATRPSALVRSASHVAVSLVVTQVALGFLNLMLLAPIWMQLVHLLFADLMWLSLVCLTAALAAEAPAAAAIGVGRKPAALG